LAKAGVVKRGEVVASFPYHTVSACENGILPNFNAVGFKTMRPRLLLIFNPEALLSPLSAMVEAFYIAESRGLAVSRPIEARGRKGYKEKVKWLPRCQ
jgi:hypothetical protein